MSKRILAAFLALCLVAALVISFVGFHLAPASAHSIAPSQVSIADAHGPHISWKYPGTHGPTFSNILMGRGFPQDDVDFDVPFFIDATLGGVCEHVTSGPIKIGVDGTFSLPVEFENCKGHNTIMVSVSDDLHLDHAIFRID